MRIPQQEQIQQALIHLDEAWSHLSRRIVADSKEYAVSVPRSQVHLLRMLDRQGALRMSDLAGLLGISQGSCTALVDRALASRLVMRDRDDDDRRVVWVTLSDHGQEVLSEIRQARAATLAQYLTQLSSEEVETLARLLEQVAVAAQAPPDRADSPSAAEGSYAADQSDRVAALV